MFNFKRAGSVRSAVHRCEQCGAPYILSIKNGNLPKTGNQAIGFGCMECGATYGVAINFTIKAASFNLDEPEGVHHKEDFENLF